MAAPEAGAIGEPGRQWRLLPARRLLATGFDMFGRSRRALGLAATLRGRSCAPEQIVRRQAVGLNGYLDFGDDTNGFFSFEHIGLLLQLLDLLLERGEGFGHRDSFVS